MSYDSYGRYYSDYNDSRYSSNLSSSRSSRYNEKETNENNFKERWYSLDEEHVFQDFCIQMINVASNFFDLTSCKGYEFWTHNNTRPRGWHIDQDQKLETQLRHTSN